MEQKIKYIDIQRYLLNYLALVRFVFKKGNLKFIFDKGKITVSYLEANISTAINLKYKNKTKKEIRDLIFEIQDFVIGCYFEYEREWEKVKLRTLSVLTGVTISSVDWSIQRILEKIKKKFNNKNITNGN